MIWLFYAFVFLLPFQEHYLWNARIGPLTFLKLFGLGLILLASVRSITRGKPKIWSTLAAKALLAFTFWRILTWILTASSIGGIRALKTGGIANVTSALGLLFIALVLIDSEKKLRQTMLVCVASMAIAGIYIIRQYLGGDARPGWPFGDANYYALYATMTLPIAFVTLSTEKRKLFRLGCVGSIFLCLTGLLLCGSRTGFVVLFLLILVQVVHTKGVAQKAFVALLFVAFVLAIPTAVQRFLNPTRADEQSNYLHQEFARAAIKMMVDHPLIGVGPSEAFFKTALVTADSSVQGVAHNTYLQLGAESGLPALAAYLLILLASWTALRRASKEFAESKNNYLAELSRALQLSLMSFMLFGMTVSGSQVRFGWFIITMAILLQTKHFLARENSTAPKAVHFSQKPLATTVSTGPRVPLAAHLAGRRPRLPYKSRQR